MKLSKDELKTFREQEEKKQAILTRFRIVSYTVTYTISYVCRTFNEARTK